MPISIVDLYKDVLPKTNCGDCNYSTCLAFATHVILEKLPLKNCPHLDSEVIEKVNRDLEDQYASGKWLKKDPAQDALEWAKTKAASMKIEDLPDRIGGRLIKKEGSDMLELPYFNDYVLITQDGIFKRDGNTLTHYEQVFIYNHLAQGGSSLPTGEWKSLVELPNSISKIKSMVAHVEDPLIERFKGRTDQFIEAAKKIGGIDITEEIESADLALSFLPLPRVPVRIIFHDELDEEGLNASVKLHFDKTIIEHLDIESIMFLSERLRQLLRCDDE